jgi:hypothetical protein
MRKKSVAKDRPAGKTLVEVFAAELPPSEFSNAMHKIGRPVGTEYRSTPEWRIWMAARKAENKRMKDDLRAADELIERLEREIEEDF